MKIELKNFHHNSLTIALSKDTIKAKKDNLLWKNADISTIKSIFVLKGIFSETIYAYVSAWHIWVILVIWVNGGNFTTSLFKTNP